MLKGTGQYRKVCYSSVPVCVIDVSGLWWSVKPQCPVSVLLSGNCDKAVLTTLFLLVKHLRRMAGVGVRGLQQQQVFLLCEHPTPSDLLKQ